MDQTVAAARDPALQGASPLVAVTVDALIALLIVLLFDDSVAALI